MKIFWSENESKITQKLVKSEEEISTRSEDKCANEDTKYTAVFRVKF